MRALKVLLGAWLVVSGALVAWSIGADGATAIRVAIDRQFLKVETDGVDEIHEIRIYSRLAPPLRVGDTLIYEGQSFTILEMQVDIVTQDGSHYHVTRATNIDTLVAMAGKLRPIPDRLVVDQKFKALLPEVAERN